MSGLSVNPPHPAIAEQGGMAGYSTQVNGALLPQQQHQPGLSDMRPLSQGNAEGSSSASARRSRPSPTASEHPHNFFPPSSPSVHSVHSATSFSGGHAAHHYPSSMAGSPPSPRPSLANSSPVNVKMEGFSSASGTDWVEIGPVPGSSRTRQASGHSTSTDHNGLPTRADSLPGSGGHPRGPGSEGVKTESAGASPASNSGGALGISAEHGQASPDIKISPGPWGSAGPSSGSAGAGAGAGASTCGADPASASGVAGQDAAAEKRQSSKFVFKLFKMVSDADYQHLISWNASGTSVVVTNFDEFARSVLGKHFKHSNFSSFIRQLNM